MIIITTTPVLKEEEMEQPVKSLPKSFLAYLRSLEASTERLTTAVAYTTDLMDPETVEEQEKPVHYLGNKKVSTFYIYMSFAISVSIVCMAVIMSVYFGYKK